MKVNQAAKLAKIISSYPSCNKQIKKWKKRISHAKWIPRLYRKRKHLGNLVYSVMYLSTRKEEI